MRTPVGRLIEMRTWWDSKPDGLVEVDGVSELDADPDPILVHIIDLRGRRSLRALPKERISTKDRREPGELIVGADEQID